MTEWAPFDTALERYAGAFWWRDDDAVADTPALHTLMDMAEALDAPLTLAVIPGNLDPSLAPAIEGRSVTTAVHGWTHTNHAPADEKKAEYRAHRPFGVLMDEASRGKAILDAAFGLQSLPLFIPPWNRIAKDLPLSTLGYEGLSVFGQREISDQNGLLRFDAHIDPIDWRGTRSAVGLQTIVNQLTELMADDAPIGLMTHHLVHDDAIWAAVETLVTRLTQGGGRWISARDLLTRTSA